MPNTKQAHPWNLTLRDVRLSSLGYNEQAKGRKNAKENPGIHKVGQHTWSSFRKLIRAFALYSLDKSML
jgi:hypothetical protein